MTEFAHVPLLSGRPLAEFAPADFKAHVQSLYFKRAPRAVAPKAKKPFSWSRNKKGTLLLRVNREPKSLTQAEFELIARESATPQNELFLILKKKKIGVA